MTAEKFCLKWNDYDASVTGGLQELRDQQLFLDLTLACGEELLVAHKCVVSACSPLLRSILSRHPHHHPLLYLRGVRLTDLQLILTFCYQGEVNVPQQDLNSFLSAAEDLQIKGLTSASSQDGINNIASSSPAEVKKIKSSKKTNDSFSKASPPPREQNEKRRRSKSSPVDDDKDVIQLDGPAIVKAEPSLTNYSMVAGPQEEQEEYELQQYEAGLGYDETVHQPDGVDLRDMAGGSTSSFDKDIASPSDLLQFVLVSAEESQSAKQEFVCGVCFQFKHIWKANVRNHVEAQHFKGHFRYHCDVCGAEKQSKQDLYVCKSSHKRNSKLLLS